MRIIQFAASDFSDLEADGVKGCSLTVKQHLSKDARKRARREKLTAI